MQRQVLFSIVKVIFLGLESNTQIVACREFPVGEMTVLEVMKEGRVEKQK